MSSSSNNNNTAAPTLEPNGTTAAAAADATAAADGGAAAAAASTESVPDAAPTKKQTTTTVTPFDPVCEEPAVYRLCCREERRAAADGGRRLVATRDILRGDLIAKEVTALYYDRAGIAAYVESSGAPDQRVEQLYGFFAALPQWRHDPMIPRDRVLIKLPADEQQPAAQQQLPANGEAATAADSAPTAANGDDAPPEPAVSNADGEPLPEAAAAAEAAPVAGEPAAAETTTGIVLRSCDTIWQLVTRWIAAQRAPLPIEEQVPKRLRAALDAALLELSGHADSVDALPVLEFGDAQPQQPSAADGEPKLIIAPVLPVGGTTLSAADEPAIKMLLERHNASLPTDEAAARRRLLQCAAAVASHYMSASFLIDQRHVYGSAVLPALSAANHACDSNGLLLLVRNEARLVAWKPIRCGEEITACYAQGLSMTQHEARRAYLRHRFGFECHCELCEEQMAESKRNPDGDRPPPMSAELQRDFKPVIGMCAEFKERFLASHIDAFCARYHEELKGHVHAYARLLYHGLIASMLQVDAEAELLQRPARYGEEPDAHALRVALHLGRRRRLLRTATHYLRHMSTVFLPCATNYYMRSAVDTLTLQMHMETARKPAACAHADKMLFEHDKAITARIGSGNAKAANTDDVTAPRETPIEADEAVVRAQNGPPAELSEEQARRAAIDSLKSFIAYHVVHFLPSDIAQRAECDADGATATLSMHPFWSMQPDAAVYNVVRDMRTLGPVAVRGLLDKRRADHKRDEAAAAAATAAAAAAVAVPSNANQQSAKAKRRQRKKQRAAKKNTSEALA